jgi:hypothetical protein
MPADCAGQNLILADSMKTHSSGLHFSDRAFNLSPRMTDRAEQQS